MFLIIIAENGVFWQYWLLACISPALALRSAKACYHILHEYHHSSMMQDDDDIIDWNTVPPAKMFHIVLQELVDTRAELKGDIADLRRELKEDIANLDKKLSGRIDSVASELHTLRIEVHQNQSTFISNQTALDKRVKILEMAA